MTSGPYDDQIAFMRDAGALAASLLAEGYTAMKIWPFDVHAATTGGQMISLADLKTGLEQFRKVRAAVGERIEVMCELHSLWSSTADCTGPVTLLAGLHLAMHASTAIFQEVVRATLATWYRDLATELPVLRDGMVLAPTLPGLGTRLLPGLHKRDDARVRQSGVSHAAPVD